MLAVGYWNLKARVLLNDDTDPNSGRSDQMKYGLALFSLRKFLVVRQPVYLIYYWRIPSGERSRVRVITLHEQVVLLCLVSLSSNSSIAVQYKEENSWHMRARVAWYHTWNGKLKLRKNTFPHKVVWFCYVHVMTVMRSKSFSFIFFLHFACSPLLFYVSMHLWSTCLGCSNLPSPSVLWSDWPWYEEPLPYFPHFDVAPPFGNDAELGNWYTPAARNKKNKQASKNKSKWRRISVYLAKEWESVRRKASGRARHFNRERERPG